MNWSFLGISPEMMAAAGNKKKKNIQNYRVNKTTKNDSSYAPTSSYAPISIDYRNLQNDDYIQSLFNRIYNTIQANDDGTFYSALATAPPQPMNIIDSTDETFFQTVSSIPSLRPAGVFSFTFYKPTISFSSLIKSEQLTASTIRNSISNYFSPENLETNIKRIYLQGLLKYAELTTEAEFENWKVVIYTDKYTINYFQNIHQQIMSDTVSNVIDVLEYCHWLKLYSHPNVAILCVTMPEYSMNNAGEIVEYSVIRMTRFHAFQLFPDVPVFVRDADTLFTKNPSYLFLKNDIYSEAMSEEDKLFLYNWEATFYRNFRTKNGRHPFAIGVNDSYKKPWHYDPKQDKESFGIFAGFVSSLGGIEEWTNGVLWDSCMKYVKNHASMTPISTLPSIRNLYIKNNKTRKIANNISKVYRFNTMNYGTYIGKDEQVLIFNILPRLFPITYFYYLDVIPLNQAVFRNNSSLAKPRVLIQSSRLHNLMKINNNAPRMSTNDKVIHKIVNIFNTPEIHEELKYLFKIIMNEEKAPNKRKRNNGGRANGNNRSRVNKTRKRSASANANKNMTNNN